MQINSLRSCRTGKQILQNATDDAHNLRDVRVSAGSPKSSDRSQTGVALDENRLRKFTYLFRTDLGGLVKVSVGANNMKYVVYIKVSSLPHFLDDQDLILSWGLRCSDSSQLYVPGSKFSVFDTRESTSNVGHCPIWTPFAQSSPGTYNLMLEFEYSQIPFYLSFLLHFASSHGATKSGVGTDRKTSFCVPVGISSGRPLPLGVSKSEDGLVNFALFSRNADSVILCLYDSNDNQSSLEIELDPYINRTGDTWHISMKDVGKHIKYAYRCKGEMIWDNGNRFHARKVLLDPYAKLIGNFFRDQGEFVPSIKCLGYISDEPTFDWSGDVHPCLPMEKMVIYRLSVENFTKDKSSTLSETVAGTFVGVIEKLQHFISLGVNAILLEPIFSFDEDRGPYFPYHFFSPMNSYCCKSDGITNVNSMKEMVKTLHEHGIEVVLEVVFTHKSYQ